jgi:hypothetical protein
MRADEVAGEICLTMPTAVEDVSAAQRTRGTLAQP